MAALNTNGSRVLTWFCMINEGGREASNTSSQRESSWWGFYCVRVIFVDTIVQLIQYQREEGARENNSRALTMVK